jgi:hypothetical protein
MLSFIGMYDYVYGARVNSTRSNRKIRPSPVGRQARQASQEKNAQEDACPIRSSLC